MKSINKKIIELREIHRPDGGILPEFSCTLCKSNINPQTYNDVLYITIFDPRLIGK